MFVTREIEVESDRIIGIEIHLPNDIYLFVFAIYMPASSLPLHEFKECFDLLHELFNVYRQSGQMVLMGDFNVKIKGSRYDF